MLLSGSTWCGALFSRYDSARSPTLSSQVQTRLPLCSRSSRRPPPRFLTSFFPTISTHNARHGRIHSDGFPSSSSAAAAAADFTTLSNQSINRAIIDPSGFLRDRVFALLHRTDWHRALVFVFLLGFCTVTFIVLWCSRGRGRDGWRGSGIGFFWEGTVTVASWKGKAGRQGILGGIGVSLPVCCYVSIYHYWHNPRLSSATLG